MAVLDKLAFLQQLPILSKGTSDDDLPCPGYLYQEIANISHESPGSCRCLLEYLLERLQSSSCHVKLKVLKILLYLLAHGAAAFLQDLRRNASFIQEAADVCGPPDPLHGISLYQKVRATAQEVVASLFSEASPASLPPAMPRERLHTGMGTQSLHPVALQGFGYSQAMPGPGMPGGDGLLGGIQRAAMAVTHAVLAGSSSSSSQPLGDPVDDSYRAVTVPAGDWQRPGRKSARTPNFPVLHRSGVPGGGWDEADSGHSSQESSQGKSSRSQSSEAGSKSGSDGQSRGSNRETADRVEQTHLSDCVQEAQLVWAVTRGNKVFLTQEEVQHFVRGDLNLHLPTGRTWRSHRKYLPGQSSLQEQQRQQRPMSFGFRCSLLNCEVVFEMLSDSLTGENACAKLRSMCAISSLMTSDLLPLDHMLTVVRKNLQELSGGLPGPVTDKATKILRQFEALTQTSHEELTQTHVPAPRPHPLDLLSEVNPQSPEEDIMLRPLSVPSSPLPTLDEAPPVLNGVVKQAVLEEDSQCVRPEKAAHPGDFQGHMSLFDGMEIVDPLSCNDLMDTVVLHPAINTPPVNPATAENEDPKPRLSSVFSFLNS
uniref:TEPSIN adaptor related protein complex 4 accessory protein n=1 Tax=Leptobrachium leishanense TaxID=445787 RepID=A0A8C5WME4_9ANUR